MHIFQVVQSFLLRILKVCHLRHRTVTQRRQEFALILRMGGWFPQLGTSNSKNAQSIRGRALLSTTLSKCLELLALCQLWSIVVGHEGHMQEMPLLVFLHATSCSQFYRWLWQCRADCRFAPSQWETALLCNDVFHWLGASLESALQCFLGRAPILPYPVKIVVCNHLHRKQPK